MLNVQLYISQLNKLISAIKNETGVTLNLSSNVVGDSNDKNNFPHELLLTNTQLLRFRKIFANNSLASMKLSKTHKIVQSTGFLGRLLRTLLKNGLPLIRNVLKPLAKSVLIPLRLTAVASASDAAIHEKIFGSDFTTLIISNEEMNDIMKIVKSFKESGSLIKGVSETIKNEVKEQKEGFLGMLLGILGASLLVNLFRGKDTIWGGKGTIRVGENF